MVQIAGSNYVLLYNYIVELCSLLLCFNSNVFVWKQYHPDMNKGPGAEEKFKEISAAYEVPPSFFVAYLKNKNTYWPEKLIWFNMLPMI